MNKERFVGHRMRELFNLMNRERFNDGVSDNLTMIQSWIIEYIIENKDRDIFQKDIESKFMMRRATAPAALPLMEKNGLIYRVPVDYDARLKKICITPIAEELQKAINDKIIQFEAKLTNGISNDELNAFFSVIDKMKHNILDT